MKHESIEFSWINQSTFSRQIRSKPFKDDEKTFTYLVRNRRLRVLCHGPLVHAFVLASRNNGETSRISNLLQPLSH